MKDQLTACHQSIAVFPPAVFEIILAHL